MQLIRFSLFGSLQVFTPSFLPVDSSNITAWPQDSDEMGWIPGANNNQQLASKTQSNTLYGGVVFEKTKKIILDKLDANCKIKCNLVYG